jgi:hypothetical protein
VLPVILLIPKFGGFVKSPSAALLFTGKGLNVRKVRLALSRLARLACETFYKAFGHVYSWAVTFPIVMGIKKSRLPRNSISIIIICHRRNSRAKIVIALSHSNKILKQLLSTKISGAV